MILWQLGETKQRAIDRQQWDECPALASRGRSEQ